MKLIKFFYLFILLFSLSSFSQKNDEKIYQVILFKWCNIENKNITRIIRIDSTGNIFVNNEITNEKIDLKTFTKGINDLISKEKLEKISANNDPKKPGAIPKNNEQNLTVSITLLKDFQNEKDFKNKSYYRWVELALDINENDYDFFRYFSNKEISILKKKIE